MQESKSLCQAAEVERDRLLELVTLLQRRYGEMQTLTQRENWIQAGYIEAREVSRPFP